MEAALPQQGLRGISSVGRATGSQSVGQGFESPILHKGKDLSISLMSSLLTQMLSKADPSQVEGLSRFFKTGPGQYGEGDKFLGIKVPVTRSVVKKCWNNVDFNDLEECISSEYHEVRLAALLVLIEIFSHSKNNHALRQQCIDFYLSHTDRINNWDLVDLSCYPLLGVWLLDKDRTLLKLQISSCIISTTLYIRPWVGCYARLGSGTKRLWSRGLGPDTWKCHVLCCDTLSSGFRKKKGWFIFIHDSRFEESSYFNMRLSGRSNNGLLQ